MFHFILKKNAHNFSSQPLDLEEDISTLGSKEVVIERRVLFRLDLPNHKSIGVKAKPNRSIRDVFKPILNKYGHRIDNCGVQLVRRITACMIYTYYLFW
jgi:regulator of G-protein signaling